MSTSTQVTTGELPLEYYQKAARNFYLAIPLYVLVPVLFWLLSKAVGSGFVPSAFGFGALGWFVAFLLRIPVMLVIKNWPRKTAENVIISCSGLFEEGIRVIVLLALSSGTSWAASLGQGWAAVEVLFTLINGAVRASLLTRTDEKAAQARVILEQQFGTQQATTNPLWGVGERIFASALHIGNTLLIAFAPWLAILCMVEHSSFNFFIVKLVKVNAKGAQYVTYIVGTVIFVAGLAVSYL